MSPPTKRDRTRYRALREASGLTVQLDSLEEDLPIAHGVVVLQLHPAHAEILFHFTCGPVAVGETFMHHEAGDFDAEGEFVAQAAPRIGDFDFAGAVVFESEEQAQKVRRGGIERGLPAELMHVHGAALRFDGKGPAVTPGWPVESALEYVAKRALRGRIRCEAIAQDVALEVRARSRRWREVRPDRATLSGNGPVAERLRHSGVIRHVATSATLIAAGGGITGYGRRADADVGIWDAKSGAQLGRGAGLREGIEAVALGPGDVVAAADSVGAVAVFDKYGMPIRRAKKLCRRGVRGLVFAENGTLLVVAKKALYLIRGLTGEPKKVEGLEGEFRGAAPFKKGWVVTSTRAGILRLSATGKITVLDGKPRGYGCPAVSPDGKQVAVSSDAGLVMVSTHRRRLKTPPLVATHVHFLDERYLVVMAPHETRVLQTRQNRVARTDTVDASKSRPHWVDGDPLAWLSPEGEGLRVRRLRPIRELTLLQWMGPHPRGESTKAAKAAMAEPELSEKEKVARMRADAAAARKRTWDMWLKDNEERIKAADSNKSWNWGHEAWGYHGVDVRDGQLVWYTNAKNPHGSHGASQTFDEFLRDGKLGSDFPEAMLIELVAAVRRAQGA